VRYVVAIEGSAPIQVDLGESAPVVDGVVREARLTPIPGTPLFQLELGGRYRTLAAERRSDGWVFVVRGHAVDVEVGLEHEVEAKHITPGQGTLRAPLPGLIVRIPAVPGQHVERGTPLVVMEAMKMENELRASGPATVVRVLVVAGQRVERGTPLVEFDATPPMPPNP
jgi:acetyl/propionyl-CoA carboxylase alpha subunit